MLYIEELKTYLMHFPNIFVWKVKGNEVVEHSSKMLYYQVEKIIDSITDTSEYLYEFHTNLDAIQYLENDEVKNGFGIVIDVDTKDRANGITIENLEAGKKVAVKIQKLFATLGINSMLKFSGGGYHIMLFFSNEILTPEMNKKDMIKIIGKIIKTLKIDKSLVKEIEIKGDNIRALYSYNSKYGNYSILAGSGSAKEDLENSKKYIKEDLDFNELINTKINNVDFDAFLEEMRQGKEKQKVFITNMKEIEKAFTDLGINPKKVVVSSSGFGLENKKIENDILKYLKEKTSIKNIQKGMRYISYYVNNEKNLSFYDKILERGVKDGRKRLLFLVIAPLLSLKINDKEKVKEEIEKWLIRSGVKENELYDYQSEIKSLLDNMEKGIKPTSIDSLLLRFGLSSKEEFIQLYLNGGE